MNAWLNLDKAKLVQTTAFALLHQAGVKVDAVDNSGQTALQQYMHWLEHSKLPLNRVDNAASKSINLFLKTAYFDDVDRRAKLILDLERLIKDPRSQRSCADLSRGKMDFETCVVALAGYEGHPPPFIRIS